MEEIDKLPEKPSFYNDPFWQETARKYLSRRKPRLLSRNGSRNNNMLIYQPTF
jgi:hypothetical protein